MLQASQNVGGSRPTHGLGQPMELRGPGFRDHADGGEGGEVYGDVRTLVPRMIG